jgi:hypothetical protein
MPRISPRSREERGRVSLERARQTRERMISNTSYKQGARTTSKRQGEGARRIEQRRKRERERGFELETNRFKAIGAINFDLNPVDFDHSVCQAQIQSVEL